MKKAKSEFRKRMEEAQADGEKKKKKGKMRKRKLAPIVKDLLPPSTSANGDGEEKPVETTNDSRLPPSFAAHFKKEGFKSPTTVQQTCWPALLRGKNALVCAPTGSGKTLGFLLPMREHADRNPVEAGADELWGPSCLVLSPTGN